MKFIQGLTRQCGPLRGITVSHPRRLGYDSPCHATIFQSQHPGDWIWEAASNRNTHTLASFACNPFLHLDRTAFSPLNFQINSQICTSVGRKSLYHIKSSFCFSISYHELQLIFFFKSPRAMLRFDNTVCQLIIKSHVKIPQILYINPSVYLHTALQSKGMRLNLQLSHEL